MRGDHAHDDRGGAAFAAERLGERYARRKGAVMRFIVEDDILIMDPPHACLAENPDLHRIGIHRLYSLTIRRPETTEAERGK
jgi:hypothetical protein